MTRWRLRAIPLLIASTLGIAAIHGPTRADSPSSEGLTIADLAAYQSALKPSEPVKAAKVTFRDLWDHPERYRGRRVRIEGKLARRFRQGKVGEFPPLAENWIFSESGDPLCAVHPDIKGGSARIGDSVRFEGTYLRTISYQGGDVSRLVPLIVGPSAVSLVATSSRTGGSNSRAWSVDWPIGIAAAAVAAMLIGRQHLRKPVSTLLEQSPWEPVPEFVEESPNLDEAEHHRTEERDSS